MKRLTITLFFSIVSSIWAQAVSAAEPCLDDRSQTETCRFFLKGYLYGLSEAGLLDQGNDVTTPSKETFSERAVRTRLGSIKQKEAQPQAYKFCIEETASHKEVAKKLQQALISNPTYWSDQDDPIQSALEQLFPCP